MKLQISHQINLYPSLIILYGSKTKTTAGYQNTITAGETHTHFKQDEKEDPAEPVFHGDEGFSVCNQPKL